MRNRAMLEKRSVELNPVDDRSIMELADYLANYREMKDDMYYPSGVVDTLRRCAEMIISSLLNAAYDTLSRLLGPK